MNDVKLEVVDQDEELAKAAREYFQFLDDSELISLQAAVKARISARQEAFDRLNKLFRPNTPTTVVIDGHAMYKQSSTSNMVISAFRPIEGRSK